MTQAAKQLFRGAVVAGLLASAVAGCSPPEKKIDPEETKRQLKALKGDLQKEHGPN